VKVDGSAKKQMLPRLARRSILPKPYHIFLWDQQGRKKSRICTEFL